MLTRELQIALDAIKKHPHLFTYEGGYAVCMTRPNLPLDNMPEGVRLIPTDGYSFIVVFDTNYIIE